MTQLRVTATNESRGNMSFDNIINNTQMAEIEKQSIVESALRRAEYNRQYQAKLRRVARLVTLEKKIDAELDHVIGYIKNKYSKEYDAWVAPVKIEPVVINQAFSNWLLLSASTYKNTKDAYLMSGLGDGRMAYEEFKKSFNKYFTKTDKGYTQANI